MDYLKFFIYHLGYLLVIAVCTYCTNSLAQCNQQMYDKIYKQILLQCFEDLHNMPSQKAYDRKYFTVMQIRKLCNGQFSTYETKNPMSKFNQGRTK